MVRISLTHPYFTLPRIDLLIVGSHGNSAMHRPVFVSSPSSFSAPSAYRCSMPRMMDSTGGGSMKSKCRMSEMPMHCRSRITDDRFVRWISGIVNGSSSFYASHALAPPTSNVYFVYSRKQCPSRVRPARPSRWRAAA